MPTAAVAGSVRSTHRLRTGHWDNSSATTSKPPSSSAIAMAPAIEWDGQWTGRTDPEAVRRLLREVRET